MRFANFNILQFSGERSGATASEMHPISFLSDFGVHFTSAWGLYDLLGNFWEWCSDIYDETTYGSIAFLSRKEGINGHEDLSCMQIRRYLISGIKK